MVAASGHSQAANALLGGAKGTESQVGRGAAQMLCNTDNVLVAGARQIVVLDVYCVPLHIKAPLPHHLVLL